MKSLFKYILFLIVLDILIVAMGYFFIKIAWLSIAVSDIAVLTSVFSVIAILTLIIFFKGQTKEPAPQTFHSLVSISLKFLLEMGLAIIWFIVAKKNSFQSVLIFFVLYLTLTLFSILVMLKTLKNRSL